MPENSAAMAAFRDAIAREWPGGEYVVDHIDDGPIEIVIVEGAPRPNWVIQSAMAAYPPHRLRLLETYTEALTSFSVYLLPKFVARLFSWYQGAAEHELNLYERSGDLPTIAGTDINDLAPVIADLFAHEAWPDVAVTLEEIVALSSVRAMFAFLDSLDELDCLDMDAVQEAAQAFAATFQN